MKITLVEQQKRNQHRFNIFLDGQFGFGADSNLVVKYRLLVGKEISSGDLDKMLFEAEVGKLLGKMYRWFGVRTRSEKEARDYLRVKSQKGKLKTGEEISSLVVDALMEKLRQSGMVDNEKFARNWVEARSKKYGINRIKQELLQKGIDGEVAEEAINNQLLSVSQAQTAKGFLEKKLKIWQNLPYLEFKKKSIEYLLRKGFEYSLVKEVVKKLRG